MYVVNKIVVRDDDCPIVLNSKIFDSEEKAIKYAVFCANRINLI